MTLSTISDSLWGSKGKFRYLLAASVFLLLAFLGGKEIWTQEHRWAEIVANMFYRHDFFHPFLGQKNYYDKPLLSYWLIAFFSFLTGHLTNLELRMPSALAGVLAIYSIYCLGKKLKNKELGLLAGWLLLTTFYFVFWSRVSSADMLNVAGSLFAVAWYVDKRDQPSFWNYFIFFIVMALTSLCKGLIADVIVLLAILPDCCGALRWRRHLNYNLLLAFIPALGLYLLPFLVSSAMQHGYHQNGLYLVYQENILRYFKPFDHRGHLYTYFIYLPIYLLPWTLFLLPASIHAFFHYKKMSANSKWLALTLLLLFVFLTLSGSRRSYYILPVVPFAILFIADWLLSYSSHYLQKGLVSFIIFSFISLFIIIDFLPSWFYARYGINQFVSILKQSTSKDKTWAEWNIVMLDAESKLNFYLSLPPSTPHYDIKGKERDMLNQTSLINYWPILKNKHHNTIFITRKRYESLLKPYFQEYKMVYANEPFFSSLPFFDKHFKNSPIAFVPKTVKHV